MSTVEEILYGVVRRREGLRVAQQRPHEPLPNFITQRTQEDPKDASTILENDLASLEMKKKTILKTPADGEVKLGKISSLILLIALAFMATLFFVVGFLTCYTLFPPYGGYSLTQAAVKTIAPLSGNNTHPNLVENSSTPSYSMRQQQLAKASGRKVIEPSLVTQAEQQTLAAAKFQAQSSVAQALNNVTSKLRDTLGSKLGGIVIPLTTGLAQTIAQQKTNQAFSQVSEKIGNEQQNSQMTTSSSTPQKESSKEENTSSKENSNPLKSQNFYTLHIRDFTDQSTAQEYVEDLKKRGFTDSHFNRLWSPQGIIYAVQAGQYKSFQEALNASKILREQGGQPTRIVPITSAEHNQ
ncbi:MAG: SPOR domain-containing protein [Candidatus Paracaedimonas acanthamoebae]|uniref:SPOR domain-containing protein n=1 Tax=Candidatus Paracaedimonas acanthamoebae TaxID=244581 RepID=A0A8J7TTH1_9PROT|nr:SPOR domain-containing protein [Candidatus Paracaedimonas acanthamoebae]